MVAKSKTTKAIQETESSSPFIRPKFLDWEPLTEEERAREKQERADARAKQEEDLRVLMLSRDKKSSPKKRSHIVISKKT
jgi:hypothetical protein